MLQSTPARSRRLNSEDDREPKMDQGPTATRQSLRAMPQASVVVGRLARLHDDGTPRVDFPGNPSEQGSIARSTAQITANDVGRDVVLMFESGDLSRPIIMGVIQPPQEVTHDASTVVADVDHQRLVLSADREIVLQCGKASITLTRSGKVLIRGAYVSSRSSGANRIKGGSVQIN
ncbi:hypothetical protein Mal15_25120 [Stieleria maiorica]|uniref:DUF6484 domain-containing protein n=1 Tax=Stieleria maiorica TaxID=2795974 RepID=A0A5B9MEP6_9BACT|nr:DUF6484 domain-containing protein [Stieleria maiorica]QEF98460.1 hypothetical protein Mal15_25120 [Stieleria maiorica]